MISSLITKIIYSKAVQNFFTIKPKRDFTVSKSRAITGFVLIALSQLADAFSTIYGISKSGAKEANGLMAHFIHQHGLGAFLLLKIVAVFFLGFSTYKRRYAPFILASIYFLVVVWNLLIISKLA